MINQNIIKVKDEIRKACERSGRDPKEVTLIAVSKTKPVDLMLQAYGTGIRCFGENKVQEIAAKAGAAPPDVSWHMIGHLQTNKVKQLLPYVSMIHSVDSVKLADQICKEGKKKNLTTDILLEVNVAREQSKYGFLVEELETAIDQIKDFPHVKIRGLMTIAPFVSDPEENREVFRELYQLFVDIGRKNIDNVSMSVLSMGMTGDYQVAIEEGATMIRVGTGIFGTR